MTKLILLISAITLLCGSQLAWGLNATAWGALGRNPPGYSPETSLNITIGAGYKAPTKAVQLKSGQGVIINFCSTSGRHSFMAPQLFMASYTRRVEMNDVGYVVADIITGCEVEDDCCAIYITPALAGTYPVTDGANGGSKIVTIKVVNQTAGSTLEQVTNKAWTAPVLSSPVSALKDSALSLDLLFVNETGCAGSDGSRFHYFRYAGGHTGKPKGPRMVNPASYPVQMLAGKGYYIHYTEVRDEDEGYLSSQEFFQTAYSEVTLTAPGRGKATALFATYPQHIELFGNTTEITIFAVPTVAGLYPISNRFVSATIFPGLFHVLTPTSPPRSPGNILTTAVPDYQCFYKSVPDCLLSKAPKVKQTASGAYVCNTYKPAP